MFSFEIVGLGKNPNTMLGILKEYEPDIQILDESSLEDEINRIVSEKICTKNELNTRMGIMKKHRCSEELIRQVLKQYRCYNKEVSKPKTIYVDPEPNSKESSVLSLCLLQAIIGSPTIYEGDKSVGKNVCAETVAWLLNKPFYLITFNRLMSPDDIFGTKTTVPPEINSIDRQTLEEMAMAYIKSKIVDVSNDERQMAATYSILTAKASSVSIEQEKSEFVEWLKHGGFMCFNEMNMAEANFFSSFTNQITDGTGFIYISGVGRVDVDKDCTLIGTQNAEYAGTCEQNGATTSRFGCIEFPYPPSVKRQLKAAVSSENKKVDEVFFSQCDNLYQGFLSAVRKGTITNDCLNIRGFKRALIAATQVPGMTKLKKQIEIHVINTCPNDERAILMAQVNDKITI